MHILFISPYVPSPIRVRPYNFIRALAQRGHDISLVCTANPSQADDLRDIDVLRRMGVMVEPVRISKLAMLRNMLRALPGDLPIQAALNFDPQFMQTLQALIHQKHFDVAHIEHLRGSALGYAVLDMPVVLDAVDSISLLFERTLRGSASLKSRLMAFSDLARTRRYEAEYLKNYEHVIVSSPEDAWALGVLGEHFAEKSVSDYKQQLTVVANGVDLDYFSPQNIGRKPNTVVFSGKMGYHANEAAALFLVQEIMPLVWKQRPEVQVSIVGSSPPASIMALANDPRIQVTGFVPDLRPYLASASVAACPLRYGVGIQNKVLEAMAMATPVVAARQVACALQTVDGQDLLLATQPEEYAGSILELLTKREMAEEIGWAGRHYVEQHHNWDKAAEQLEHIYRRIAAQGVTDQDVDRLLHMALR